ncbi:PHP domain-containing protein, partial [Streptomyces sp. NPDC050428]|uniref:PHP domain-containing protein n=1 Tax=Streptomyces sp. NPDC050428 TaxID=3155757 RepID=UPI003430A3A8
MNGHATRLGRRHRQYWQRTNVPVRARPARVDPEVRATPSGPPGLSVGGRRLRGCPPGAALARPLVSLEASAVTKPPFTHLHVHTQYSLLDGAARLGDMFKACNEM